MALFIKNGKYVIMPEIITESSDMQAAKGWYIVSNAEVDNILTWANCWSNSKMYGQIYDDNITKLINELENNI
jgi:hypothetical protein